MRGSTDSPNLVNLPRICLPPWPFRDLLLNSKRPKFYSPKNNPAESEQPKFAPPIFDHRHSTQRRLPSMHSPTDPSYARKPQRPYLLLLMC